MTQNELAKRRAWAAGCFGDTDLTEAELECATYMPSENFSDGWDAGVKYASASKWISVKDKLPRLNELVLICICEIGLYRMAISCRSQFCGAISWSHPVNDDCVIAWMPLPEHPQFDDLQNENL